MKKRTAPRIITGKLKGHRLKSLPGNITRPITDRVKENLFNIIGSGIHGCLFLDAFSGTGSVGLEAYSRGAKFVQFIEKNQKPYIILKENLLKIDEKISYSLVKTDALKYLRSEKNVKFDFIFIAPPQYHRIWIDALNAIEMNNSILEKTGTIIVQIDPIEFMEKDSQYFHVTDRRKYGSTLLLFFGRKAI